MLFLYNIGIRLFDLLVRVLGFFKEKPALMFNGRKDTMHRIATLPELQKPIWIHCASLGEFEQGRPIIEAIKKKDPNQQVVLTFFSPSGYEVRKDYELADYVFYLPSDTASNAQKFIDAIRPSKVLFVKYEFWYHYLKTLHQSNIPVYSVSSIFRPEHTFFKSYGKWYRKMLSFFTEFYVQDEQSLQLLRSIGVENAVVAGDTRFDRVYDIAQQAKEFPLVEQFTKGKQVIVGGSSWPAGEKLLISYIHKHPEVKLLLAPHEIHDEHISQIESMLQVPSIRYTKINDEDLTSYQVLIVDTMGMLSSMYQYGTVAYIGGGFGSGIHNTIEASTFGLPVLFGPKYKKYQEACDLVELKGGFEVNNQEELDGVLNDLLQSEKALKSAKEVSISYVEQMRGATTMLMKKLF